MENYAGYSAGYSAGNSASDTEVMFSARGHGGRVSSKLVLLIYSVRQRNT